MSTIAWSGGEVTCAWHEPSGASTYLVLAHGAGGTKDTPSMRAFAEAIAERGIGVLRFNFPYADAGRKSPGKQSVNEECWRGVAEAVRPRAERLVLGGRSYGGRIASHIVADGFAADGLVFLAYPLHPPGKYEQLRDAHLRTISQPMLFLQGTRDAFARSDLLHGVIDELPTATLHALEDGDHGHKVSGRTQADVVGELVDATFSWLERI